MSEFQQGFYYVLLCFTKFSEGRIDATVISVNFGLLVMHLNDKSMMQFSPVFFNLKNFCQLQGTGARTLKLKVFQ